MGTWEVVRRALVRVHRALHGLAFDLVLYLASAAFAGLTALTTTLPAHRPWGQIAFLGYAVAAALTLGLVLARRHGGWARRAGDLECIGGRPEGRGGREKLWPRDRAIVTGLGWLGSTLVPLVVEAAQRAAGHPHRAQEEVLVVESGAVRLLESGTPYLGRDTIAGAAEPLLAYLPYQPGMVLFGLPRALFGEQVWTDARVWFALVTAVALLGALRLLRDAGVADTLLIRAAQAVTVLPVCALTLATGGDDLPVLGLCLLALCYAARGRPLASGIAMGTAAALKLFAWPVAVVLVMYALIHRRFSLVWPTLALPLGVLLPVVLADPGAVWENVVRFPLGLGLVKTPAASPLPGHLIAVGVPGGRGIAVALLLAAGVVLAVWLLRRPPATAAAVATVSAVGLMLAILLMPATRFGYLLYPAGYAVWAVALATTGAPRTARAGAASGAAASGDTSADDSGDESGR